MKVHFRGGHPIKVWADYVPIDKKSLEQIGNVSRLPFIHKHVALMPDAHFGIGATVGSVIPTTKAVIPAAVGVDIGCGMMATRLDGVKSGDLPDSVFKMRREIEVVVPVGRYSHAKPQPMPKGFVNSMEKFINERHPKIRLKNRTFPDFVASQIGTLGGGNHFIELCVDETDSLWVMLHTGSRGIGNRIGSYFIALAKEEMGRYYIDLPDKNLAYLPEQTTGFADYMFAVKWAQEYAALNRAVMMKTILEVVQDFLPPFETNTTAINCHHNYISQENFGGKNVYVTRKGAIRARAGELGIIPGSMGDMSFIVRGTGSEESFNSCSHGAGRLMSRTEAKKAFTLDQLARDTEGVECRKDVGVIDEIPSAYKDIHGVMQSQEDLVDIVHRLCQVMCIKG